MNSGRLTLFDSPMFLGFDHFEETLNRVRKSASDGYPPYNIEQISENDLRITLAVAGFSMDDLDVEVDNRQLTIYGRQYDDEERIYLYRGIATRQFQRSFVLADGIEVRSASIDRGLLHIELEQVIPESSARKIKITDTENASDQETPIDLETTRSKKAKNIKALASKSKS